MVSSFKQAAIAAATLASSGAALKADGDCNYAVEIIQLQDASASFTDDVVNMKQVAPQLFDQLQAVYPGMKYGLAAFVDKPLPMRGYGPYGGYQVAGVQMDYCYQSMLQMTDNAQLYRDAIDRMAVGSGFDFQENQLEAMLRCALDTDTGYTDPTITHDAQGRPIVRVMIMITDASPHHVGDAAGATTGFWDWPVGPADNGGTTGGWGADDFGTYECILDKASYTEAVKYFKRVQAGETLSAEDLAAYNDLKAKVGPEYIAGVVDHPGDNSLPCEQVEYPTVQQMGQALKARSIYPIILLASSYGNMDLKKECDKAGIPVGGTTQNPDTDACLRTLYEQYMDQAGIPYYLGQLTEGSENIVEVVVQAVSSITDLVCIGSTLPPPPPFPVPATTTHAPTPAPGPATTTTTGTGAVAPVPAPAPSGGGIPIGPIAGAAGGAVAAAAAGYFAYAKWGALGKKPSQTQAPDVQVEVPEEPVEREAVEEVTMEMFQ